MAFNFGDNENQQTPSVPFVRYKMSDMENQTIPQWLIRDLMFRGQLGVLYAPPRSFKSFLALSICSSLVHGMIWQNRYLKPCRVIYVAGEGFTMFYSRRLAWFKHHNMTPDDDGLEVIHGAVNLCDAEVVDSFIAAMKPDSVGVELVVFDTLSTCTAGQNENDGTVMTMVIENAKRIIRELNCAVLFVHHPGKDISRGSRGHSSLLGNIDFEWMIERIGKAMDISLTVTKQKDGEDGQTFHFHADKIPLGLFDDDGVELDSLVLSSSDQAAADSMVQKAADRVNGDRLSIAKMMDAGIPLSLRELAKKLEHLGGRSSVITRINAAVPEGWTQVHRTNDTVYIRRVVAQEGSRKPHLIEMQLKNIAREMVF